MTDEHLNWISGLFVQHDLHAKGITFEQFYEAYKGGFLEWYLPKNNWKEKEIV